MSALPVWKNISKHCSLIEHGYKNSCICIILFYSIHFIGFEHNSLRLPSSRMLLSSQDSDRNGDTYLTDNSFLDFLLHNYKMTKHQRFKISSFLASNNSSITFPASDRTLQTSWLFGASFCDIFGRPFTTSFFPVVKKKRFVRVFAAIGACFGTVVFSS